MYEQRTSIEIENAFKQDKQSVRLQISGFYYIIDLKEMIQYREDFPNRIRRIMRERTSTETVKGVAGIVVQGTEGNGSEDETKVVSSVEETEGDDHIQNITGVIVGGTEGDDHVQDVITSERTEGGDQSDHAITGVVLVVEGTEGDDHVQDTTKEIAGEAVKGD